MTQIQLYIKEVYNELVNKVTWPTWADLQSSAIVVMIASLLIALTVYVMDSAFSLVMDQIYSIF